MRRLMSLLVTCAVAVGVCGAAAAQEKPRPSELKVQVVFTEFDGDRKVASLPYSFTAVGGGEDRGGQYEASLRLGISVPIITLTKDGESQTQYQDVGTNIDCRGWRLEDGRYKLTFSMERSSVYSPDGSAKVIPANPQSPQPVIRRYRGSFDLLLRDGQTADGPIATDPQSGRVLKTEVSLKVTR